MKGITISGLTDNLVMAMSAEKDRSISVVPDPIDGGSYLGSKGGSGAYQAIIAAMPPHDTYIEPFLGSGIVMREKPPAEHSIGIDINPAVKTQVTVPDLVEVLCTDSLEYLSSVDLSGMGRVFIYCDPPYLWSTRTSNKRYRFEFDSRDHRRLCAIAHSLSAEASIAISGYPNALYDNRLAGWRTIEFQVMTRGGPRTEKLWMNYPISAGAAWCDYAGSDFTDRQRIKRKAARWASNYASMPPGEKLAVLAAMLEHGQVPDSQPRLVAPAPIDNADIAQSDSAVLPAEQTSASIGDRTQSGSSVAPVKQSGSSIGSAASIGDGDHE